MSRTKYRKPTKAYVRCCYCYQFEEFSDDMKHWAKVKHDNQVLYFHDRELGDCYDLWLLSDPSEESEVKDG